MKIKLQSRNGWICLAIAAMAVSTSGCKSSGFSMPGKNMFSWNRQPDAATLAGNTKVPSLPESPAAKYDPAAIASKYGSADKSAGSAYGYGGAGTAAAGSGSAQPGGAAIANGYQSGPYPLASKATTPATNAPSTATTGALPSPYGGTYNGSMAGVSTPSTSAGRSDVPLPTSVATALGAAGGLPAIPNSSAADYTGSATATPPTSAATTAYQLPGGPGAGQIPAAMAGHSYPSAVPGASASGDLTGLPALPGSNAAIAPGAGTAGSVATPGGSGNGGANAYSSSNVPASYSPGSTGRSTSYDFGSPQTSGAAPATSPSGGTLPLLR